jgi:hypothetical protein
MYCVLQSRQVSAPHATKMNTNHSDLASALYEDDETYRTIQSIINNALVLIDTCSLQ